MVFPALEVAGIAINVAGENNFTSSDTPKPVVLCCDPPVTSAHGFYPDPFSWQLISMSFNDLIESKTHKRD